MANNKLIDIKGEKYIYSPMIETKGQIVPIKERFGIKK